MNKIIFFFCLLSLSAWAETETPNATVPVLSTGYDSDERDFNPHESHWTSIFAFETMKYETPFEFSGVRKSFSPNDQEIFGARLGIGREFYLGKGLTTTSRVEGYYLGTLFSKKTTANPELDIEFANYKRTSSVYGFDLCQALGLMFDFKTKNPFLETYSVFTLEPFIEAGLGVGQAYNRVSYRYDTSIQEDYRHSVADTLANARVGAGLNLTSNDGYFLFLRATVNRYDIISRKSSGAIRQSGGDITSFSGGSIEKNAKIDPVAIYTIGGGYKF